MLTNNIRIERAKKNVTQAELAYNTNVSRVTISSIETNRKCPSVELALKIARYLDVPINSIFKLED